MITLIIGPMHSSKSTLLLAYERRFTYANKSIVMVKWSNDNRYTTEPKIITHDGATNSIHTNVISVPSLSEVEHKVNMAATDVILIDEGQFYSDLKDFCTKFGDKQIVISCLSGDYKQCPFSPVSEVISIADHIIHQKSICTKCGQDAPFTIRTTDSTEQIVVGDGSMYQPRCRSCLML
jgi:thymidine kinase